MLDLISAAHAQAAAAPQEPPMSTGILFMVLMFAIFYFLLIRPQQKQQKTHREMVANLQRGDSVVTAGGMLGRIHRVEDDIVIVEVGEVEVGGKSFKPVRIRVQKGTITTVTAKAGGAVSDASS